MRRPLFFLGLALLAIVTMGQSCTPLGSGTPDNAPTGPAGVFMSTDKGDTWVKADLLPTAEGTKSISGVAVYALVSDPHDVNTIYLASRQSGLLYTYDAGRTWRQPPSGPLTSGFVYDVVVHPKDPCTIYATNSSRVYKSVDCARTWQDVYQELRPDVKIVSLDISSEAPYRILLAGSNGDLLVSEDVGATWNVLSRFTKSELVNVAFDPQVQNRIFVVSKNDGLYRSTDGGATWTSLKQTLSQYPKALEFRRFAFHPNDAGTLYWISTYGILVSTDAGDTWNPINLLTQPGSVNIYAFEVNPKNDNEMYYTATIAASNRSTLYKSVDGGQTWTTKKLPTTQIPVAMFIHPEQERMYLGFTITQKK